MRDFIIYQLKSLSGFARFFGFTQAADFIDKIAANPPLLDFVIGVVEDFIPKTEGGTVGTLSVEALSEEQKELLNSQAIDIGQIIALIKLIMGIWNSFKGQVASINSALPSGESCQ